MTASRLEAIVIASCPQSHPMTIRRHPFAAFLLFSFSVATSWSQAIQNRGANEDPGVQVLNVTPQLPELSIVPAAVGEVSLLPGLFRDRRNLTKSYLLRLKTENILQNHLLEAGIRIDRPAEQ